MVKTFFRNGVCAQTENVGATYAFQRLCRNRPTPCHIPHARKLRVMPCHKPISTIVETCNPKMSIQEGSCGYVDRNHLWTGLKKYARNHWVNVICQLFQNKVRFGL